MKHIIATVAALFILSGLAAASDLATLKGIYENEVGTIVLRYDRLGMTKVSKQYSKALYALLDKVKQTGDREKTDAVIQEITRFKLEKTLPRGTLAIQELQKLQGAVMQEIAFLEKERDQEITDRKSKYDKALEKLQIELLKTSKIASVRAVKAERDALNANVTQVIANKLLTASNRAARAESTGDTSDANRSTAKQASAAQFPVPADAHNFALIPAGAFTMGDGLDNMKDAPEHEVKVSGFYMGTHEVSWRLWREVRDWAVSNGYPDLADVGVGKGDTHPVHSVNWYDVVKWCNAASERAGLQPVYYVSQGGAVYKTGTTVYIDYSKQGYRLPTEAEWEKAARGGLSGKRFTWGDTISHKEANYKANDSHWRYDVSGQRKDTFHPDFDGGGRPHTSPVGSFPANGYGLYDMSGNVWEWCNDWYDRSYYSRSPSIDPEGPALGSGRVRRGGGWFSHALHCRVAIRGYYSPDNRRNIYGFRLALSHKTQLGSNAAAQVSNPMARSESTGATLEGRPPSSKSLVILEATYGAKGAFNDVLSTLNDKIVNDSITLQVNNRTMGGDPKVGTRKALYIRYAIEGMEYTKTVEEDRTLSLPEKKDRITEQRRLHQATGKQTPPRQFPVPVDAHNFALIPAGAFTMGDGLDNMKDAPEHEVKVSGFYMGTHEVSWRLWREVRDWAVSNGYPDLADVGVGKGDTHPVHSVNWYDVVKWCNAASERAGLQPVYYVSQGGAVYKTGTTVYIDYSKQGYRLPTEAEWEKAARGGLSGKRFPWGDTISHKEANYYANSSRFSYDVSGQRKATFHPDFDGGGRPYTSPVGSFPANGYGLYDVSGNVWEWCNDWYESSYYSRSPGTDPQGPSTGSKRALRGSTWHNDAPFCRVADRNISIPDFRSIFLGFRLALSH